MRFSALAVAFGLAALAAATCFAQTAPLPAQPTTAPWDYEGKRGALEWGKLDPAYQACKDGHEQSPIDIRGAKLNKALPPIEFHYLAGPVTLLNNGHTVQVIPNPGSYILVNGMRYDLVQWHFHHPGEEAVRGKITDMDIHLVHKSADGKLAVIAIRLTEDIASPPNAVLADLFPLLPAKIGASVKVSTMINTGGVLPGDRGYWTYGGSLTAPPCTEGVRWFIFEQEMTISRDQLRAFAALYKINSRALQDPHGRGIEANE